MAQLGARFHGMEEVESSNLSRSTTPFQRHMTHQSPSPSPPEYNWSPNLDATRLLCQPTPRRSVERLHKIATRATPATQQLIHEDLGVTLDRRIREVATPGVAR